MSAQDNLSSDQFETFYHRTNSNSAGEIIKSGKLKPSAAENHVFVSNTLKGRAQPWGSSVVEVRVPKTANRTDYSDSTGVGEKWFAINPRDAHVVRAYSELGKK
jgi:hypothetical protein